MKQTEFLIIGQGISGTFLSWYLHLAQRSFVVIDDNNPFSSSRIAAGIINPVTGRRIVTTWMIDTLLPFALRAYSELGKILGIGTITQKNIVDFFPSPQMLNAYKDRMAEDDTYLSMLPEPSGYNDYFNYDFGCAEIDPVYIVHLQALLPAWRNHLKQNDQLIEEKFEIAKLIAGETGISYRDLKAEKIIFCDGIRAAENPWFQNLPFAPNKGQALIIRADDLPENKIYKKGITLVPLDDHHFWAGSSHEWNFTDDEPSAHFYERTKKQLELWLKIPFTVERQLASVRPATIERRPFAGIHPHNERIGILNGMGTKGCSLAPYFADQFVNHLTKNTPILPEANVNRFTRILQITT